MPGMPALGAGASDDAQLFAVELAQRSLIAREAGFPRRVIADIGAGTCGAASLRQDEGEQGRREQKGKGCWAHVEPPPAVRSRAAIWHLPSLSHMNASRDIVD
jgi:hypothetical protein